MQFGCSQDALEFWLFKKESICLFPLKDKKQVNKSPNNIAGNQLYDFRYLPTDNASKIYISHISLTCLTLYKQSKKIFQRPSALLFRHNRMYL